MSHITDLRLMITETWGFSANNCYKNIDTGAINSYFLLQFGAVYVKTFLAQAFGGMFIYEP